MRVLKRFLAGFCLEAFAAAAWSLLALFGSGTRPQGSPVQLMAPGLAIILLAALLLAAIAAWRIPAFAETLQARLDRFCLTERRLPLILLVLLAIPVVLLLGSLAFANAPMNIKSVRAGWPDTASMLHSLVLATLPIQVLVGALALESAAYLGIHYRRELAHPASGSARQLGISLLALGVGLLTVFYWLVLILQLRIFKNLPAWYWKLRLIPLGRGDLLFVLGAVLLIALAYWLVFVRRRALAGVVVLFLLGLFFQFGVALMSGNGFAGFQDRYLSTFHKTYLSKAAASSASLLQTVQQYEQLYGARSFTETKPPGLMLFYTALDHTLSGFPARYPEAVRFERLVTFVSFAFPVLAALLILAVYAFARRYVSGQSGSVPGTAVFLLALCPNFVLFSLYPDQALYPLVFLLGIVLIIVTVRQQSLLLALLLGLFLYAAVFFAFSMLPLFVFAGLYLALYFWGNRRELRLGRFILLALAVGLGTLLLYLVFRLFLSYDFIPRFAKTMKINHDFDFYVRVGQPVPAGAESIPTRLGQIAGAAWFNNLDFSAAVGFVIYALFLVQSMRILARLWRGSSSPSDLVVGALILSFGVLNLAGTAQGEVPRLWLFWLPMVVIAAALEMEAVLARRPWLMLLLAGTQLVTLFLTFHFQDLRM